MYHLSGDDFAIFRALEAITNTPLYLDPVKWSQLKEGEVVPRRLVQTGDQGWTDADFDIGDQINHGEYDGMYIEEVLVLGGKFLSFADGSRPPFRSGVKGDMQRLIKGLCDGLAVLPSYEFNGALDMHIGSTNVGGSNSNVRNGWFYIDSSEALAYVRLASRRVMPQLVFSVQKHDLREIND